MKHFILTRFNIRLWNQDKCSHPVRSLAWLEQRFDVFERFCLPSVSGQVCKDFVWIVLVDSMTPQVYKDRIESYKDVCPQFVPVYIKPEHGRYFCQIFRKEVLARIEKGERVITTYLDNDDALNVGFVADVQAKANEVEDNTFICYPDGVQYFADMNMLLKVHYPANHFISLVELGDADMFKTVYGYGSHAYIAKQSGIKVKYFADSLQWCEVVHERNMVNDAFFLFGTKMVTDSQMLRREFSVDLVTESGVGIYIFKFVPKYVTTFIRRARNRIFGRKW